MAKTLAVIYRPTTFKDVVEQDNIKAILLEQLKSDDVKNAYLFCGSAGTGKTTCARIFANEINGGKGKPIEIDAASNSGVDNVREIGSGAYTKSISSEYKVYIIDECHSISNTGWQAFLKLIEEPPAKTIFIFCTTNPEKIPKTILSRVQRYDFQRISNKGIVGRLKTILKAEKVKGAEDDALRYIAKLAEGGMRDAISLVDKCLAYNKTLTLENVVDALGVVNYDTMKDLTECIVAGNTAIMIRMIEDLHGDGKDLKQFIKMYVQYLLDLCKYGVGCDWDDIQIPKTKANKAMMKEVLSDYTTLIRLLKATVELNSELKWSTTAKYDIESKYVLFMEV